MEKDYMPQESPKKTEGQPDVPAQEIDLMELLRKVWGGRKLIFKWCCIAAVFGIVVAFSIPKEYVTTVKLAPEISKGKTGLSGLGALADMAGVDMGNLNNTDAMYPILYPDIVASVPFNVELFNVQVSGSKGEFQTDVYDYLLNNTRQPWWSAVSSLPGKIIGGVVLLFKDKPQTEEGPVDTFRLTRDEMDVVKMLNGRIAVSVDKKSSVISLAVTMQDPLISATLTDTVMRNLQNYITEYRTNKARNDLAFTKKLFDEAQRDYYRAQQRYARYLDANNNVVLRSVRTEQERLQNEMNLAYNVYTQASQQLQIAKVKVQENTPVYAVLQPATVPLKAARPSKLTILIGFVFLGGALSVVWILMKEQAALLLKSLRK